MKKQPKGFPNFVHGWAQMPKMVTQINPWDPVTKICRSCIQSIDRLIDFRIKHTPVSIYLKEENSPERASKQPKLTDNCEEISFAQLARDEHLNLELSVSDSDCSLGDTERRDPLDAEQFRRQAMRPELLQLIGADLDGRNFQVLKDDGEHLKVVYKEYPFRFLSQRLSGSSSQWVCIEAKLRACNVRLEIDASGKTACMLKRASSHSHSTAPAKLMVCPPGKGTTRFNGHEEPFWMFYGPQNNITRILFVNGYRYFLFQIKKKAVSSIWHCGQRRTGHCNAILNVGGVFERVDVNGSHNHTAMDQRRIDYILERRGIDLESTDAMDAFQLANPTESIYDQVAECPEVIKERLLTEMKSLTKEKNPEIFQVLDRNDPDRNFTIIQTGGKFKVVLDRYEYRYFGKLKDGSTIWKCIMDSLHHCLVIMKVSMDGKRMEIYKGRSHNHDVELAEVFRYPIGKRMIGEEPLWLLTRVSIYYESRYVVYRDYLFVIQDINRKGIVRWCCFRKHSCRALLVTKGDFQEVNLKKGHSHEKPQDGIISGLMEGKPESEKAPDNLTFKQKLLSFPATKGSIWDEGRNEFETYYIISDIKMGERNGYAFIFRGYRYAFGSLDQNGTSRWVCSQIDVRRNNCKVIAVLEGLFESVAVAIEHKHEPLPESKLQLLIKRSVYRPLLTSGANENASLTTLPNNDIPTKNVLATLARHDPDRNFSVGRVKSKLLINYEGDDFRLKSREPEGDSIWNCTWLKVRGCPVSLRLSGDGKQVAVINSKKRHNHSDEQIAIFLQTAGKSPIFDEDRDAYASYWLYCYQSEFRSNRGIIYQGYKYRLHIIGNNTMSTWKCRNRCRAYVRVEGTLKTISCKNSHNHEMLTEKEIRAITGADNVDVDLLPTGKFIPSSSGPTSGEPLRISNLLKLLSLYDPDRNYQVTIHKEQMRINQEGYEYCYKSSTPDHTLWKCIYSSIRSCRATLHVDSTCKQGFLPKFPMHNHFLELWDLFYYPLGESSIMDACTELQKPFWFLMQHTFLRSSPNIIYDGHRYALGFITKTGDSSKWSCVAGLCRARLTVTGLFELVVGNGVPHGDAPLTEEKQSEWIRRFGTPKGADHDEYDDTVPFVEVQMDDDECYEDEDL